MTKQECLSASAAVVRAHGFRNFAALYALIIERGCGLHGVIERRRRVDLSPCRAMMKCQHGQRLWPRLAPQVGPDRKLRFAEEGAS